MGSASSKNSNSGFGLLQALLLLMLVSSLTLGFVGMNQRSLASKERSGRSLILNSRIDELVEVLGEPDDCAHYLVGKRPSEITSIENSAPATDTAKHGSDLLPNTIYLSYHIEKIAMTYSNAELVPSTGMHKADIAIVFSKSGSSTKIVRNIPVIIVLNGSGAISSCYAGYTNENGLTLKDQLCFILDGRNSKPGDKFFYNPATKDCTKVSAP